MLQYFVTILQKGFFSNFRLDKRKLSGYNASYTAEIHLLKHPSSGEDDVSKGRDERSGCRVFLFGLHDRSDFQIYAD